MKRKARIQAGIDDRLVAIYARKSRITNKGDSIGVQFKQSADYAVNQLSLPEDYEFIQYEDKGLSGYYSDRPDFQRLLRDVEMGKIKAVACYKLDRISRKTSDLMRLLEYFERHDVTLLVCSNNINTQISTSKIIIQVLAIIAEFERDILTERIQDNLMELAKDGRWLGGKTPTGFSSKRVTTGSGKNKSAISFLVPIEEEKEIVLEIYRTFWETRSLLQTANLISEKYETKHGAKFTTSTIRLILRNPIYCVADEYSYNYFLEHDGNLFGEAHEFDGKHGLSAYNKTDQMKVEDEDSTFFNPKFSQLLTKKPISEWIVSVGRHEGFISSRKWVETQNMLDEIAEKYNRPHRKTNALLSGLMYCPICGKRLRVLPESNRWTNGKPRFKYACPGVRAKECTFKGVEGVTLDEFVIHSLSSLQEEHSDYYRQLLENRVASMIRTDQGEKEYQETKKAIERLNADIAAQVRNLREADDALKRFIQDDIKVLTDDLAKREADLRRIENTQSENHYLIHELNSIKKRLLSFEEFAKDAQPETLFTLVHSIVDRIYITTDGSTQKCQVYIKGCATEDYSDILGAAEYIDGKFLLPVATYMPPMCDLDKYSIFYVAMTRTKNRVYFIAPEQNPSEFLLELKRDYKNIVLHGNWNEEEPKTMGRKPCPICGYPLQLRYKNSYGLRLFICTNEPEVCGFMTNEYVAGKLSIMKCDCCRDGYMIVKHAREKDYFLGCTNYKKDGTGCNNVVSRKQFYDMMGYAPEPAKPEKENNKIQADYQPKNRKNSEIKSTVDTFAIKKGSLSGIEYKGRDLNETIYVILSALQNVSTIRYYGTTMLVDVLHGESTKRMLDAKLNMIPQFAELCSFSKEELYAMIAWLITNGYILKTKGQYPVLHPTYNGIHYAEIMTEKQLKKLKKYLDE